MAGKKISGITGELILNVNKWSAGVKAAQKDGKALESALKPIGEFAGGAGKAMAAAGVAMGASLLAVTKRAADYGDQIQKASIRTGIGTKELSAYKLLAERSDTSFEALTGAVGKLSNNIFDAATNAKGPGAKAFKAFGIEVKDAGGNVRQASDILPEVVDRLASLEDGTEKTALAQKFFGKSAAELIPLINDGSEGFRKAQEDVKKFGLEVSEADAALGAGLGDALTDLQVATNGLGQSIGTVLIPSVTKLIEKGTEWATWAGQTAKAHPELTKAVAGTAAALTGAGGLLLGLAGIATVAPKVATGLKMITTAMAGTEVLLAVRNYGDLSAAISLIGEKGILAKAGLVGFAAFIGYTAGQMINGAIAASGYQKQIDSLILTLTKSAGPLGYVVGKWAGGQAVIDSAAKQAAATTKRSAELLAQAGVTQEQATAKAKGLFEANQKLKASQQAAAESTDKFKINLGAFNNEATKTVDKVKQLNESFIESVKPADALQKTIGLLRGEFATQTNILKVYGPQIIETVESQKAMGLQVSSLMANYYALAKAETTAMEADKEFQDLLTQRAQRMAQWNQTLENSKVGATEWTVEIDRSNQANLEGVKALGVMRGSITETTAKIKGMQTAGKSDAEIIAVLGGEMRTAADTANKLRVALDPTIDRLLRQADAADRAAQRAKNLQDSWGRAMSNMVTQTAHSLADMIVDWDFSFKSLAGIAKNTAKDMLGSFLEGFFQPFADKLEGFGQKAGGILADAVFGSSGGNQKQSSGGLLGSLDVGGMIGGLFGKNKGGPDLSGGITLPDGTVLMGPTGGGGGFGGLGGFGGQAMSSLQSFMNPVQMGLNILNTGLDVWDKSFGRIGQGRKAADQVVKSENAFTESVKSLLADSTLSTASKSKIFENTLSGLQSSSAIFGATDPNNQKVVNQMFANLAPFIQNVRAGFERDMPSVGLGSGGTSIVVNATFNHTNTYNGTELTPIVIRDVILPEEIRIYKDNIRGYGEALAQAIASKLKGLSGSEVPTPA